MSHETAPHRHPAPDLDDALWSINSLLANDFASFEDDGAEGHPLILVVGPPRSGTTLAIQTIAAATGFGYLTNVAALLWARPALGVQLSRMIQGEVIPLARQSHYGRTHGATEPHEAGRLWTSALGCNSMVEAESRHITDSDLRRLRARLRELTREFARPTLLKGFHATFVLPQLKRLLPELRVLRLHRPTEDVVRSIVRMREESEDPQKWLSIQPILPDELLQADVVVQAAAQAVAIEKRLDAVLRDMDAEHVMNLDLDELTSSPQRAVDLTVRALGLDATYQRISPANASAPSASQPPEPPSAEIDHALATVRGLLSAE